MNVEVYTAPVKKKLVHSPRQSDDNDSSPGSSPIQFTRVGPMCINLDSDEDSNSNDCVIVPIEIDNFEGTTLELKDVESKCAPVTTENAASAVIVLDDEEPSKIETEETSESQSTKRKAEESDDEALKPLKRKKKILTKKKNKGKKKMNINEETHENSDYDEPEDPYQNGENSFSDEDDMNVSKVMRDRVLDFLNSGTEKHFYEVPSMTKKKMETIVSNRPFVSWIDVVFKFGTVKGLPSSLLKNVCDTIKAKDMVKKVLSKCEKLAAKTERRVTSVGTLVSNPPLILNPDMKLSNYQLLGLNWLALMRSESLNSILADEMGLGKTIQVIALLAYLKENDLAMAGYPHLIVVPASTLDNWANELAKWCPSLKVLVYYGSQDERRYLRHVWFKEGFKDAEIILTTYSCATSSNEEKKMFRVKEFNYIIFDEAHMLKNMNTQRYEALFQFNGNYKVLLTGTPLQNNLLELMSLLNFLMPNLFENKVHHLKILFSKCSKSIDGDSSDYEKERVEQARRIIEPFMLRRTKDIVLREQLPPKTVSVEKCHLTDEQRAWYDLIVQDFKADLEGQQPNCHMYYFMMLRKLANHPLLLRQHFTEDKLLAMAVRLASDHSYKGTNADYIREDLYHKSDFELHCLCQDKESLQSLNYEIADEVFLKSGKFEKLTLMLRELKENGHRVLIFSQFIQMLDIMEEFSRINNYSFLRLDGATQTSERQELIDLFNSDENIFLFLLSTRAGGLGINLTSADTVIIHDIDYNPYNDKQAEDRCHRIGQTKPVQVLKLISEGTVEESIQNAAVKKLVLEKEVTSGCDDDENPKNVAQLLKESLGL